MKNDAELKGRPVPKEVAVGWRFLHEGFEAPELGTVKDFLRFHATTSRGKIG
jgi:hypothetical protein